MSYQQAYSCLSNARSLLEKGCVDAASDYMKVARLTAGDAISWAPQYLSK